MVARRAALSAAAFTDFGTLLRVLRKRARLTQRELGLAVGYSEAQISRLEQAKRLPDPAAVAALFLPALRLGSEPELAARLQELAAATRARDTPDAGGIAARSGDLTSLPPLLSLQVTRAAALAELRDRVTADRCVLITGLAGTGKTSLAATLAREQAKDLPVCWITLTAGINTSAEALIRQLVRFLCRHGHEELGPLRGHEELDHPVPRDEQLYLIAAALTESGGLICLDNLHLLRDEPDARSVIEHIAASSPVALLGISREELDLAGFAPFRLDGLTDSEAHELIAALAGPVEPEHARALIRRTLGNPMLLRLGAAKLRTAGTSAAAAALISHLESEPGVAAFLVSAALSGLGEPARRITAMLAVFRHPVDLLDARLAEASEALDGAYDVPGGIGELRRRQLIDHPASAELHPLIRDHVYAGLVGSAAARGQLHLLAARHCARGTDDPFEASWHYAQAGDPVRAADMLTGQVTELIVRGCRDPAADLAAELLAADGLSSQTKRLLLVVRGDLLTHTERAGEAEGAYRQALAVSAPPALRADTTWRLAQCLLQRGKVPEALDLCLQASDMLTANEVVLLAQLAAVRARAHLMLSELDQAAEVATRARAHADQAAQVAPAIAAAVEARACWVIGVVERLHGHPQDATGWLGLAVSAARVARLPEMAGRALFNLGAIAFELGEVGRAQELYAEALAELRLAGDGYGTARVLHGLGMVSSAAGAPDEAIRLFEDARAAKLRMGDALGAASSEHSIAHALLAKGQTVQARESLESILKSTAHFGERVIRAHFLDSLAMVELADGDPAGAMRHLTEASEIANGLDSPAIAQDIQTHTAFVLLADGDLEAARSLATSNTGPYASRAIEHQALIACLALASGDLQDTMTATDRMAQLAEAAGELRYRAAALRIAAVATTALGGATSDEPETAELFARLPRLVWVDDP